MKVFKRNAVILTVLVFVCAAVYLNWSYGNKEKDAESGPAPTQEVGGGGLYYEGGENAGDYFSVVRLSRRQARDTAMTEASGAAEAMAAGSAKDSALAEIADIAAASLAETEIESLVKARGFADCVVFLDGETAVVTVPAPEEGLSKSSVAQIADAVMQKTELGLAQIRIIEVK